MPQMLPEEDVRQKLLPGSMELELLGLLCRRL